MIDDIVEQVGEENVIQIVTNNAANYKAAAHRIDLILEDLEKKIKAVYPPIKVLLMVDSDEKPTMGFIYNEMKKAKQKIKTNFKDDRKSYDLISKVIDERWEVQLHRPLHAGAYYLNPQLHFSSKFRVDREVMRGLYKVMDRMLDDEERDKIYTKRRNQLYQKNMNDLVFVIYNLKLKDKKIKKQVDLQVEDISSDDEWIVEEETENTATLSHNYNLRSLGRGDDGDEESGGRILRFTIRIVIHYSTTLDRF
ncbi:hypothetical protein CRG98_008812 [Punica granatum]|uniref:DUF659 domain-containing protein n=1 Tax=Punica granatum TaxID=22663 RepID=A0A2I0KQN5_PUNGR|nr:hypothetical protein CRG98_008812 [Punica granatum]